MKSKESVGKRKPARKACDQKMQQEGKTELLRKEQRFFCHPITEPVCSASIFALLKSS
jgi:hypothetical protein